MYLKRIAPGLVLMFLFNVLKAQQPTSGAASGYQKFPHWIEMMNDTATNYFEAVKAFDLFWKSRILPVEEEDILNEHNQKAEERKSFLESLFRSRKEKQREESEKYAFQVKKFRRWQLLSEPFVQSDGSILFPAERKLLIEQHVQVAGNWQPTGPIAFPTNASGQINGIGRTTQMKFDPNDSMLVYATTASGGLWISHDAGQNWAVTGTDVLPSLGCASVCIDYTNNQVLYLGTGDPNYYGDSYGVYKSTDGGATWNPSNNNIGNRMALELLMDPADHNVLIAATSDGIWKTSDGGASWQEKHNGDAFTDMIYKPFSGDTVYACTYSEFYRSVNGGDTWTQVTNGVFVPGGDGHGMRLAVSVSNPNVVYLGMIADEGTILKSVNGGTSFSTVYHNPAQSLVGYDATSGGQGNYNFDMTADPDNSNVVFVVAHCVWRSDDGGISWTKYSDWWADCHTDMHHIVHSPYNHSNLFNANDGGIFVSHDGGNNWDPSSDGLGSTECYHGAMSPYVTNMISIGTQDNGELYYNGTWLTNRGGDWGAKSAFDYQVYNRVWYLSGERRIVSGGDVSWNPPFVPGGNGNDVEIAFTPSNTNIAFVGQTDVWRSDDISLNPPVWTQVTNVNHQVKAIAISATDANDVWVVLNNAQLLHSTNALSAAPVFIPVAAPAATNNRASIALVKNHPDTFYISCNSNVYRTANGGASWTNITANLPNVNILKIYHDDYSTNEKVYVGSNIGVYYHTDTSASWLDYSQGLPTICGIQDFMMINDGSPNSRLRVAYYGRGVWETEPDQPLQIPSAEFVADATTICPGTQIQFTDLSTSNTTSWSWTFPGGTPAVSSLANPIITYNTAGIYSVTLVATNANGNDVEIKSGYINVTPVNALPLAEGFSTFYPLNWTEYDDNNDNVVWMHNTAVGGYGASSESAYFDNYNHDSGGARDALRTPRYDLTNAVNPMLTFDLAYAMWSIAYNDSLAVLVSTDCDTSYTVVYVKGAAALATAPNFNSAVFVPDSSQWRTDTISLLPYTGYGRVTVAFENIGHYGQALYIDNVNIQDVPLSIATPVHSELISVFPNPTSGRFTLHVPPGSQKVVQLINSYGQIISTGKLAAGGSQTVEYDLSKHGKGLYMLNVIDEVGKVTTKKIVVE